ncbi:MAG: DinB family protein, partial [Gammaproteobacteria bacterium]|nr:DinB family protein [Gammaproteobacteria bacterium]
SYLTLAKYHQWATQKVLEHLKPVSDEDYYADKGLFFKSIHGSLNHILLVDKIWYGRFTGNLFEFKSLAQQVIEKREDMGKALHDQADIWIDYVKNTIDDAKLESILSYVSSQGVPCKFPFAPFLNHAFNHGTHHRGQISTAISQLGFAVPEMDIPYYLMATSK